MTISSMQHMPLECAYLCADCHCVGNCASHCPACASRAIIGLAGILNREEPAISKMNLALSVVNKVDRILLAA